MAKKRAVVITFGRFQPPTIGHEKLINAVIAHANKIGAEHRIYASQSFDGNRPRAAVKNPLQYNDKIKFMRKMFPNANIVMGDDDTNTFMRVLYQLQKEKYTTVHVVVGDDRVPEITKTVKQYLGSDDPETGLNFEDFKVVSAGKRDPEAEGVEGMSASKLRAAAAENDFKLFKKGMPSGFSGARELFDAIRKGLERPMKPEKKTKTKKAKVNEELLNEVTPPDEKSERFVKKAKSSFKDRYGDDWASYLYGVAWKQYNKRHGRPTKTRLGEPIEVEEETLQVNEGSYVHSSAELKAAIKGSKEEIKSLTMKLKMLKKAGLSKESIKKAEDDIQFWQDNLADAEEQLKGMKESHEIQEANENIKKVKKMGFQTLYQFGGKYYIVSTSPMADETAIFNSDKNGDIKNYREIWSERERVSHDYAIKDYIDNKFKAFGVQIESFELDEATIPRDAQIVDRNKEEKTVTLKWNDEDGWHEEEVPEDEVPGFYDRAADPMKKRKTDRFGNIMKTPVKGAEKKTEKAMAANKKDAEEILEIFKKKPMKTPITVIGTKWGKAEEYEMVVMKRMYQGDEVFVVKSSGRFVELRPTAAGLQVIDQKTKKILLDKGKDATW
jgi:hypothetical protein